ncbi:linker for activation of T-cells family member 1 isoform X4 [Suricata suricatta]|uniref:linker for activation of T-cells family member 1 isoform X4 n=1 Tax=Suricata suricatta TaxID=37032 RepID=UPI0011555842|nr:linker for activation of T-cells family member 1 isoform X4 [Suricata suricatta]
MEAVVLMPYVLGLLLLPLLALLAVVLCVRCRELPGPYDSTDSDSATPSIVIKRPPMLATWTPATAYPSVTSYPSLSQPDLLPIPRSPQPPGGSHRMPSCRQDSDGEPPCEDDDEDEEEDYPNEGYLEVLPDGAPATSTAVPPAPAPSNPGLRDSAFSMESGEDYVNVPDSEESADVSLDGSREYVNVSQELPPMARTETAILGFPDVDDDYEGEGLPDYENLQNLN